MLKINKVLLLFSNDSVKKGLADPDSLKLLLEEAALKNSENIEIYISYARSLSFLITNNKVKIRDHRNHMNLEDYDFVYFRKAGSAMQQMLTCALYLKDHEIPFFDKEIVNTTSRNKLSQMYMLQRRSVPIPKTLFCRNNRRLIRLVSERYCDDFSFPIIAKATGGTRGDANYLVNSIMELKQILSNEHRHFIIQEFIPNDGDLRFFIAGGLKGIIKRCSIKGSHLNNTSKGGSAILVDVNHVSNIIKSDALNAAIIFGRDCAGVDIIVNKNNGTHYILEVNRAPQIEHASFESEKAFWMINAIQKIITDFQPHSEKKETYNIFGRFEFVYIILSDNVEHRLVAKVDTGADSSSLHATNIRVEDHKLVCEINDHEVRFSDFVEKKVKSSNGLLQHRYLVSIPVKIGEVIYNMKVTLTDRSGMNYDMLIGRRFLRTNNLLVNVSLRYIASGKKKRK